ncbi:MAG: hypothetical protein IT548_04355 [Alphaproteobacteria bacterium]|nr:hypothetical protein [Alphaproteobacteria bacterium]
MRRFILAAATVLACGLASADSPPLPSDAEAKWRHEIDEANIAYAKRPTAILKIDDAVYLKPGQTAWLIQGADHMAWSLKAPEGNVPSVAFAADSTTAIYSDDKGKADLLRARPESCDSRGGV